MALLKEDALELLRIQKEALRHTMNVQAAAKIDVYYFNGTENGSYTNTNHPIPSSYRILNVWNFSTKRIFVKDKQGRTLAEVPQKTTDYFNSYVGAPTGDLYFTIEWSDDYGFEEFADLNIEGTEFWIVASNVPLLGPKSLLADLIALKQYGGISSLVDEGINVKNMAQPWNRFSFQPIENIWVNTLVFNEYHARLIPGYENLMPEKDRTILTAAGKNLPADAWTRYNIIGAYGMNVTAFISELRSGLNAISDQIQKREFLEIYLNRLNGLIEIFNINMPISNGIQTARYNNSFFLGIYHDGTAMVGDFNFSDGMTQGSNLYDNNIRPINPSHAINTATFDGFYYGNFMRYGNFYDYRPSDIPVDIDPYNPYWTGLTTRKQIPYYVIMSNFMKKVTASDQNSYGLIYQYPHYDYNYSIKNKLHNFTIPDMIGMTNYNNWIVKGNPIPYLNATMLNYFNMSQQLIDLLHGMECDYFARFIQEQINIMPQLQVLNGVGNLNTIQLYDPHGNTSGLRQYFSFYYSLDRFDFFKHTYNYNTSVYDKVYIGSILNQTNKKYISVSLKNLSRAMAVASADAEISLFSDAITGVSSPPDGNLIGSYIKNNTSHIYIEPINIDMVKPLSEFILRSRSLSSNGTNSPTIFPTVLQIKGSDFFRGE